MVVMSTDATGWQRGPLVFEVIAPSQAKEPGLRHDLLDTWVAVTDAGGSVGFVPPADRADIAARLDARLVEVADGRDALGVLRRDGTAVGMGVLVDTGWPLQRHWRTVLWVMVRPELQGQGAGRLLMDGLHQIGRDMGLEHLELTARGGTGLERFYEKFGYVVVGRHPGAIRVAPGDDRDEVMLVARL